MKRFLYLFSIFWISMISLTVITHLIKRDEIFPKVLGLRISGRSQLEEKELIDLVKPFLSMNFGMADTEKMRNSILAHPYVKDATVKRIYPFYLHIHINERIPSAIWIGNDGSPKVLDEEGNPFRGIRRGEKGDLLVIRADEVNEVRSLLKTVKRWEESGILNPSDLSEVLSEGGSLKIITRSGVEILLGREEIDLRLRKALKVLNDARKRGIAIKCMDTRFEKGVIIKEARR